MGLYRSTASRECSSEIVRNSRGICTTIDTFYSAALRNRAVNYSAVSKPVHIRVDYRNLVNELRDMAYWYRRLISGV